MRMREVVENSPTDLRATDQTDVAIIGGGPAGVAAGLALRGRGVERVIILEREGEAGGAPRHCGHPPFGMREFGRVLTGPRYARRLAAAASRAGIDVRLRHSVVALREAGRISVASSDGSYELAAKRIILAMGARENSRAARLAPGDRPIGVLNTGALQAYIYLQKLLPFRRPVIVGTELVSLSAILTCLRAGVRPAGVIEANAEPTARWPLSLFPRLVGVGVHYSSAVVDIHGGARVEGVTIRRADGLSTNIECDGVLFTGCFTPEAALARMGHLAVDPGTGGPIIDDYGRCSDPAYFAAGNVLRPVETAGWSFREGRRVGLAVADDLAAVHETPQGEILVRRGVGVKLIAPQRLSYGARARGFDYLQLRVDREISGDLQVAANGSLLWRRRVHARREKRILIPLCDFHIPANTGMLDVGFAGLNLDRARS